MGIKVLAVYENKVDFWVRGCLSTAYQEIGRISGGGEVIKQGSSFGDFANDTEIAADRVIGKAIEHFLFKAKFFGRVTVEGFSDCDIFKNTNSWITVDPLDGSLNYMMRNGSLGLPYSSCATALEEKVNAKFKHIVGAGIIDLRNGDRWTALRRDDDGYRTLLNGEPVRTHPARKLDLGSQIVIGEMYYPQNRELLCRVFSGMKGWLRNPGSAAYEMALVSSGSVIAYICDRQKQHELGAAYALVKGAGGVAVDFDGVDLGERVYEFNAQTPVILASCERIAGEIIDLINK